MATKVASSAAATEGKGFAAPFQCNGGVETRGNHISTNQLAAFFSRIYVVPATGCWHWKGVFKNDGYGMTGYAEGPAYRQAYAWFVGPIPPGFDIDHLCRIRACVNPAHLEAVTKSENVVRARAARITCVNGHPWIPENIIVVNGGSARCCRTCKRAGDARAYERRKARNA